MSKKLTAHLMSVLEEGVKRLEETGADTEHYISILSKKEAIVKADDDFSLGLALGMLLGTNHNLVDGLEFKFLSNVEYGKLYQLALNYPEQVEPSVLHDLGLTEA